MEEKIRENSKDINILKQSCSTYEKDLAVMQEQITEIKDDIREIKENQEKYMQDMKEFMSKMALEKADKWVEKFLLWAGGIIGGAIILGILGLLAKAFIHLS